MPRRTNRADDSPVSFFSFQDIIASVTAIMIMITMMLSVELAWHNLQVQIKAKPIVSAPGTPGHNLPDKGQELQALRKRLAEVTQAVEGMAALPRVTPGEIQEMTAGVAALDARLIDVQSQARQQEAQLKAVEAQGAAVSGRARGLAASLQATQEKMQTAKTAPRVTLLGGNPAGGQAPLLIELNDTGWTVGRIDDDLIPQAIQRFGGPNPTADFRAWLRGRSPEREYYDLLVRPNAVTRFQAIRALLEGSRFQVGWDVWPASMTLFPATPTTGKAGGLAPPPAPPAPPAIPAPPATEPGSVPGSPRATTGAKAERQAPVPGTGSGSNAAAPGSP